MNTCMYCFIKSWNIPICGPKMWPFILLGYLGHLLLSIHIVKISYFSGDQEFVFPHESLSYLLDIQVRCWVGYIILELRRKNYWVWMLWWWKDWVLPYSSSRCLWGLWKQTEKYVLPSWRIWLNKEDMSRKG